MKKLNVCLLILVAAALLAGCIGPKPEVVGYTWQQSAAGQPALVEVVVKNDGSGEGETLVAVSFKDKTSGDTIAHDERKVELQPGETQHVTIELDLPPSQQVIDANKIAVEVTAQYPVE